MNIYRTIIVAVLEPKHNQICRKKLIYYFIFQIMYTKGCACGCMCVCMWGFQITYAPRDRLDSLSLSHTHTHTHTYSLSLSLSHTHTHTRTHTHICHFLYRVCVRVTVNASGCVCVCACVCVCLCVCVLLTPCSLFRSCPPDFTRVCRHLHEALAPYSTQTHELTPLSYSFFLSFFLGWRRPNFITGLSLWCYLHHSPLFVPYPRTPISTNSHPHSTDTP